MRKEKTPKRNGLLFQQLGKNDYHLIAKTTINALFEEAARDWPLGKKKSFWERVCYEPLVDVGAAEAWFEKWIGALKND